MGTREIGVAYFNRYTATPNAHVSNTANKIIGYNRRWLKTGSDLLLGMDIHEWSRSRQAYVAIEQWDY